MATEQRAASGGRSAQPVLAGQPSAPCDQHNTRKTDHSEDRSSYTRGRKAPYCHPVEFEFLQLASVGPLCWRPPERSELARKKYRNAYLRHSSLRSRGNSWCQTLLNSKADSSLSYQLEERLFFDKFGQGLISEATPGLLHVAKSRRHELQSDNIERQFHRTAK